MGDVMTLVLKQRALDRPPHAPYAPPMPRQARLDAPGALHHVMARGIERYTPRRCSACPPVRERESP